jgi:hypothetical protein
VRKIEHLEAIADGRGIQGHIGIVAGREGIGEIVAAAAGEGFQAPVALDELDDRNVIVVGVDDMAARGVGRNDDERNAFFG